MHGKIVMAMQFLLDQSIKGCLGDLDKNVAADYEEVEVEVPKMIYKQYKCGIMRVFEPILTEDAKTQAGIMIKFKLWIKIKVICIKLKLKLNILLKTA